MNNVQVDIVKSVCKEKLKSQEKCTSNGQCYNHKCGRNHPGDDLVCCTGV